MYESIVDRLHEAVRGKDCCGVVNIDPVLQRLPQALRREADPVACIEQFSYGVTDAVAPHVPVVKFNIAYFERYGPAGCAAYGRAIAHAKKRGLIVIGDIKRGDVDHTAQQYVEAHQSPDPAAADAITINGYFGWDGVEPFVKGLGRERMVFVLVRTSNPSAATIQDLPLADGRTVHEAVGTLVDDWSRQHTLASSGYGPVGAVVATRNTEDAARLRAIMPHTIFLVPGYGAQGGTADDFRPYLDAHGFGALIAAGRSVIYACDTPGAAATDWKSAIAAAASRFADDLRRIMPGGRR